MASDFTVRFRGVRGTVPVPGESVIRYGGNTSCVEVRCGRRIIIFDAGTGIISLGDEGGIKDVDIFLSHTHLDHIQGFPFFKPLYDEGAEIRVWSGHLEDGGARKAIEQIMTQPVFPIPVDSLASNPEFIDFKAGENVAEGEGVVIKTLAINHPDNATAYRIEYQGKSVCYVTDIEHVEGEINQELVEFIKDADLFIYDSTFTDENYHNYKGWGHSTWQEGVRLSDEADVEKYIAFHHDPNSNDDELDKRATELSEKRKEAAMAKEGQLFEL